MTPPGALPRPGGGRPAADIGATRARPTYATPPASALAGVGGSGIRGSKRLGSGALPGGAAARLVGGARPRLRPSGLGSGPPPCRTMNLSSIRRRHVVDGARWRPGIRLAHGRGGRSRLTSSWARCTRFSAGSPRATAAQGRGPLGAAVGRRLGPLRGARRQDRRARWLCRRLRPSRRARRERRASRPEATRSTFRGHRGDRRGGPTAAAPGVARRSAGDRLRRVRDGRRRHQRVALHAGGRPWPPGWSAHDGGVLSGVGPLRERAGERKRRCATRAPSVAARARWRRRGPQTPRPR